MSSALEDKGVDSVWEAVEEFVGIMHREGVFHSKRRLQRKLWMWNHIDWQLASR